MKNRWKLLLIILAIGVLITFVLPLRRDWLNDGGTTMYEALVYTVVSWNAVFTDETGTRVCYKASRVYWYPENQQYIGDLWDKEMAREDFNEHLELFEVIE